MDINLKDRSGIVYLFNYVPAYEDTLYTPRTSLPVNVYRVLGDFSIQDKNDLNDYDFSIYYGATWLSTATARYNCHSYAWYSNNTNTNDIWMNEPLPYYQDHSYCCVTNPQVGDIVCYFDNLGTPTTTDDENIHSGIITAISSGTSNGLCGTADLLTVTSKWGPYALYSHNGYYCPYTNYCPMSQNSKTAEYVKYYRHATYLYQNQGLFEGHLCRCTICNSSLGTEDHDWITFQNKYKCRKCGLISSYIPVDIEVLIEDDTE